jgi:tetratricopeptide (TPR) repeat protein
VTRFRALASLALTSILLSGCLGAPDPSLDELTNLAASEESHGNHASAIALYNRAIQISPENAGLYCNRGSAKGKEGDLEGEIADDTRALEINPQFAAAFCNRGTARGSRGDLDGEISDETSAINLAPDFMVAYRNRAWARSQKGDKKGASEDEAAAVKQTRHTLVSAPSPVIPGPNPKSAGRHQR